jgi:hypothetical protein
LDASVTLDRVELLDTAGAVVSSISGTDIPGVASPPHNAVFLSHDDDFNRARTSAGGLVLVTAANAQKVEGTVLFLSLRNAFGGVTDEFPISTFLVSTP